MFAPSFNMKHFTHLSWKNFTHSEHLYTHYLVSTINILLYLLYVYSIHPSFPLMQWFPVGADCPPGTSDCIWGRVLFSSRGERPNAAQPLTLHRTSATTKNYPAPVFLSAEVEKPCINLSYFLMRFIDHCLRRFSHGPSLAKLLRLPRQGNHCSDCFHCGLLLSALELHINEVIK